MSQTVEREARRASGAESALRRDANDAISSARRERPHGELTRTFKRSQRSPGPVRFATTMPNTLTHNVMLARGWREVASTESNWDFFYADVGWIHENLPYKSSAWMEEHQRVNHFSNHAELTRKDLMAKNLHRARRQAMKTHGAAMAERFNIIPLTYVMPQEAMMMRRAFHDQGGIWIMKPIGRAQGKGIFLVHKASQISKWLANRERSGTENVCVDNYVAQRYISNPYCVGGRKFDLRLYVLVMSFRPLRVYLYREGFARFTAVRYTCEKDSLEDEMVHLTNHAVQKRGPNYDATKCDLRWSVRSLRQYVAAKHGTATSDALTLDITKLIVHSLQAVAPVMINDRHCFEMYGYDIMLDDTLRPWLIEVNASPSMSVDSASDRALKTALFNDVLDAVDMESRRERDATLPRHVGGFDMIVDGEPVEENMCSLGSLHREERVTRNVE